MVFFSFSSELFHLLSLSITTTIQHGNQHKTRFAKICSLQRRSLFSPLQLSYSACPCLSRVFRLPSRAAANCNLHQQTPPTTTAQLRHSPLPAVLLLHTLSRLDTHIHSTKPSTRQHSRRTVLLANDCATPHSTVPTTPAHSTHNNPGRGPSPPKLTAHHARPPSTTTTAARPTRALPAPPPARPRAHRACHASTEHGHDPRHT